MTPVVLPVSETNSAPSQMIVHSQTGADQNLQNVASQQPYFNGVKCDDMRGSAIYDNLHPLDKAAKVSAQLADHMAQHSKSGFHTAFMQQLKQHR